MLLSDALLFLSDAHLFAQILVCCDFKIWRKMAIKLTWTLILGKEELAAADTTTSPYGEAVEPEKAPEAISRAVASLPPEQMFELMKQMKLCIQNNPTEARNMLLQNPQLAYALLQAQVVMRIVDPKVAMAMLHRQDNQVSTC